jgi:hypothetical protein
MTRYVALSLQYFYSKSNLSTFSPQFLEPRIIQHHTIYGFIDSLIEELTYKLFACCYSVRLYHFYRFIIKSRTMLNLEQS